MFKKARLLLKVDRSSKGAFVKFIVIVNFLMGLFYIYQSIVVTPNIETIEGFRRHILFMLYQHVGSVLTIFMALSLKALIDFKKYSNCLVFPITYEEFILFIKLRYGRFTVITILLNILNFIVLGIKFNQPPLYYLIVIASIVYLTLLIYLGTEIVMYFLICIFGVKISSNIYIILTGIIATGVAYIIKNVSEIEFYKNSMQYIDYIEGYIPNLIFIKMLILQGKITSFNLMLIFINLVSLVLLYLLYRNIVKHGVYKLINSKENKRTVRGKSKISNLRKRGTFVANILLEFKFFKRENVGKIVSRYLLAYVPLSIAIFIVLIYLNAFEVEEIKEIILYIKNMKFSLVFIILGAFLADYLNYEFSTNSFQAQREYVNCIRYLNVDFKKLFFAKFFCKVIVALSNYFFLVLPLFLYRLVGNVELKLLPLGLVIVIIIALINTVIDFNFPNIYEVINVKRALKAVFRMGISIGVKVLLLLCVLNGIKFLGILGISVVVVGVLAVFILILSFVREIRLRHDCEKLD